MTSKAVVTEGGVPATPTKRVRKRRGRLWKRTRRGIGNALLPIFAPTLLSRLSASWRLEEIGAEHWDEGMRRPGRLVTLWHGRMLVPIPRHRDSGHKVLVSPSDDGSIACRMLGYFGYKTIRGSSSKRPAKALREMLNELQKGGTIGITPDGPRGPRHTVNPGAAWMARATGYPILTVGCATDSAWHLNSWDEFTIPKPRARVVLVYGKPIYVESDAPDSAIAEATEEMGQRLLEAERVGFAHLGLEPDW